MAAGLACQAQGEGISISALSASKRGPVELFAFGGKPLPIEVCIDGKAGVTMDVTARIYQTALELAAPLREPFSIGKVTLDAGGRGVLETGFPVPEVPGKTDFAVRIEARADGLPALSGACLVRAFPGTFTDSLETISGELKRTGRVLAVFGESPALRSFLKNNNVPFVEMGAVLPERIDDEFVYVGAASPEAMPQNLPRSAGATVIIFTRNDSLLPGVYRDDASRTAKVTLPVLESLADSPLSQATFFHVLAQSLPTETRRKLP